MGFIFRRAFARRGAVYLFTRVKFKDKTKAKYCVLMEDYADGAKDLIVIFTTHRTEFKYQRSSVFVSAGVIKGITGDTLIQCSNFSIVPSSAVLEEKGIKYLGTLPPDVMEQIDEALTFVRNIDEATLIRMQRSI